MNLDSQLPIAKRTMEQEAVPVPLPLIELEMLKKDGFLCENAFPKENYEIPLCI